MNVQNGILTILGCGDSAGVPRIGNDWGNCDPLNPRNVRTRASIAVQVDDTIVVVDTGADFRLQINRENFDHVDGVLYTHAHGDHVHGIDELRVFHDRFKRQIDVYSNDLTLSELEERFSYMFRQRNKIYPAVLQSHRLDMADQGKPQKINGLDYTFFEQDHGTQPSLGFRFGDVGYSTDMVNLTDSAIDCLKGIKTWVVDAANYFLPDVYVHANKDIILRLNERIGAEKLILTHLKNDVDYTAFAAQLPPIMEPAYDGMKIALTGAILRSL